MHIPCRRDLLAWPKPFIFNGYDTVADLDVTEYLNPGTGTGTGFYFQRRDGAVLFQAVDEGTMLGGH